MTRMCLRPWGPLSRQRLEIYSGLSRRSDRSLYFRCDLYVKNPILDWQQRPQTSHGQTPWFDDASALCLARFERSESTRLSSKSMTASRHRERQADLLNGAWLSSRGSIPQAFRLDFTLEICWLVHDATSINVSLATDIRTLSLTDRITWHLCGFRRVVNKQINDHCCGSKNNNRLIQKKTAGKCPFSGPSSVCLSRLELTWCIVYSECGSTEAGRSQQYLPEPCGFTRRRWKSGYWIVHRFQSLTWTLVVCWSWYTDGRGSRVRHQRRKSQSWSALLRTKIRNCLTNCPYAKTVIGLLKCIWNVSINHVYWTV